jgi:hypothetical protein
MGYSAGWGLVLCGKPADYILDKAATSWRIPKDFPFVVGGILDVCEESQTHQRT